ncbi:nuclear transport factor 2 family protein [Mucilaginibacter limnophilus]|uniref:Nuclear transport factor 2 family protein n=2 Tax=Mucilaginibacter limnophilus TaxID=1932778 RepID=A0A3S2Y1A3_9SPHI|nr:nuclear transport factor 2 family protein [Mucilaginibacter limnophilus]
MTQQKANEFAKQWIEAWNSHDLDRIMAQYAEEVEFNSPMIISLGMNDDGRIMGKTILRQYFEKGLNAYPELNFKLHYVFCGIDSLVIKYESVNGKPAAEVMQLNATSRASHVTCHY